MRRMEVIETYLAFGQRPWQLEAFGGDLIIWLLTEVERVCVA